MELNRYKSWFHFCTSMKVEFRYATTYWGSVPGFPFALVAFDLPTPVVFAIVLDLSLVRKESFELQ